MNVAEAREWMHTIRQANEKVEAEVLAVIQHSAMTGTPPLAAFVNGHTDAVQRVSSLLQSGPEEIQEIAREHECRLALLFAVVLGMAIGKSPLEVLTEAKTQRALVMRELEAQIEAAESGPVTTH